MSNQRFRSDYIDGGANTNLNTGRRYRGKVRSKWDQRLPNDLSVSFGSNDRKADNNRQIRFNTNKDYNNDNNYRRDYSHNRRGGRDGTDRSDRSFANWANSSRSTRGRTQYYSRNQRRNAQTYNQQTSDRNRDDIDSQWFKITIPHGNKLEKQQLLHLIQDSTQLTFTPFKYHIENGGVVFFVLGGDTADALKGISRKISVPSGHKLIILVNRSAIPPTPIDDELMALMTQVMAKRYNSESKVMDLSQFREDESLIQLGLYVPLSRPNMLNACIKIIIENTPEIIGLNLKGNKLSALETLVQLSDVCLSLRAIDLSLNQIRNATELEFIKGLELIELALEGNPVCDTFEDQAAYISCIRTRFPKLAKLDGEELPPAIGFDVQEVSNLPPTLPGHLPDNIQNFIHGFFEAFYNIYDSEDRQPLVQAYHDSALFSMSISRQDSSHKFAEKLILESRNLLRVKDYTMRNKLIKSGKIQIVSTLCEMPKTKHIAHSFCIDVPFCNNSFVLVVVNGVFRELLRKQEPLRAFCRTFYVVPQSQGFVIVNDILLLTNATVKQIQTYGKNPNRATGSNTTATDRVMTDVVDSGIKSRLGPIRSPTSGNDTVISQFMSATQMNRSFAAQCLEENGYDMDSAFAVFQKLKAENLIPNEAFV